MPLWPRLRQWLLTPTPQIAPPYRRVWILLSVGLTSAIAIHLVYIALFIAVGAWWMVVANAVSMPMYAAALALNRRGRCEAAVAVSALELWYHQTLAVLLLGWAPGLQYFLMVVPAVVLSLPGRRYAAKALAVALTAALYAGLALWSQDHAPRHALPAQVGTAMNLVSIAGIFGLLGLFAQQFSRAAEVAEEGLQQQFDRAEALLHNILPQSIAERLKHSKGVIADGFAEATVMFADLAGFTHLSAQMPPEQLVRVLNDVFSAFDDLIAARGLEKIKTIGDAYMVAAGIPEPRADHAEAIAELALQMQATLRAKSEALGIALHMRIGIHSGPVVAGVIGTRKFIYDLWGDTVNVAARMESHGVVDQVQISRATLERLGPGYACTPRGPVQIKGKGEMDVYLLQRRDPA